MSRSKPKEKLDPKISGCHCHLCERSDDRHLADFLSPAASGRIQISNFHVHRNLEAECCLSFCPIDVPRRANHISELRFDFPAMSLTIFCEVQVLLH